SWETFRDEIERRVDLFNPVVMVPTAIAAAAWLRASTRRLAWFYGLAAAVYATLAAGPASPLFWWYLKLPMGNLFRVPARFLWVASFCIAVLTGLGTDAILRSSRTVRSSAWRIAPACWVAAALVGLSWLSPNGLYAIEWGLGAAVVGAALVAAY